MIPLASMLVLSLVLLYASMRRSKINNMVNVLNTLTSLNRQEQQEYIARDLRQLMETNARSLVTNTLLTFTMGIGTLLIHIITEVWMIATPVPLIHWCGIIAILYGIPLAIFKRIKRKITGTTQRIQRITKIKVWFGIIIHTILYGWPLIWILINLNN